MAYHFTGRIASWDDWSALYQDIPAFLPLIDAIYASHGLAVDAPLEHLTPGTNAVFRRRDTVIKIFAPKEAGFDGLHDFTVERAVLGYLEQSGVATSNLLAAGVCNDAYTFYYLILRYVHGREAGHLLEGYGMAERADFAREMRKVCGLINRPVGSLLPGIDIRERAIHNPRLQSLPEGLRSAMVARAKQVQGKEIVLCHGDLTGENVLVTPDGMPIIIDCADSVLAPSCYELPVLVFELFRCRREMVLAFAEGASLEGFMQSLLDGLSLHDFGANILCDWAKREGIDLAFISDLKDVGDRLHRMWT